MKTTIALAAITLLATAACGRDTTHGSPTPDHGLDLLKKTFYEDNPTYTDQAPDDGFFRRSTPAAQRMDASLLAAGARQLEATPQLFSVLVMRHGYLVDERYFHGSSASASNNVHSASKSILSMLVGNAIEQGLISSVDATLGELLPGYRLGRGKDRVKLRDLLTMTAGFKWEEDDTEYEIEKKADWVQAILDLPLATTPGQSFNYSTGQSHVVSAILSKATGLSTQAFAEKTLFRPLGIDVQHWGSDPQGINSGGCNVYMTPRSLAKIGTMALGNGRIGDRQIVPAAWLDASWRPAQKVDETWRYGYFWWLRTIGGHEVRKLWGYGGQLVYVVPDADLVVVMTTNTRDDFEEYDGDPFLATYVLPALQ